MILLGFNVTGLFLLQMFSSTDRHSKRRSIRGIWSMSGTTKNVYIILAENQERDCLGDIGEMVR